MMGDNRLREKMAAVNGQIMCVYYRTKMERGASAGWEGLHLWGQSTPRHEILHLVLRILSNKNWMYLISL